MWSYWPVKSGWEAKASRRLLMLIKSINSEDKTIHSTRRQKHPSDGGWQVCRTGNGSDVIALGDVRAEPTTDRLKRIAAPTAKQAAVAAHGGGAEAAASWLSQWPGCSRCDTVTRPTGRLARPSRAERTRRRHSSRRVGSEQRESVDDNYPQWTHWAASAAGGESRSGVVPAAARYYHWWMIACVRNHQHHQHQQHSSSCCSIDGGGDDDGDVGGLGLRSSAVADTLGEVEMAGVTRHAWTPPCNTYPTQHSTALHLNLNSWQCNCWSSQVCVATQEANTPRSLVSGLIVLTKTEVNIDLSPSHDGYWRCRINDTVYAL